MAVILLAFPLMATLGVLCGVLYVWTTDERRGNG